MNEQPIKDAWSMHTLKEDGKNYLLRFNTALRDFKDQQDYPYMVGIAVPFKTKAPNGSPTGEELTALAKVEDTLLDNFNWKNDTILTGTITGEDMREFVLYTKDPNRLKPKLDQVLEKMKGHEFQGNVQHDPEWEIFKSYNPK